MRGVHMQRSPLRWGRNDGPAAHHDGPVADRVPAVLGLIPAWGVPGLVDWWFHRRSGIERPDHGGTEASLIHSLMLAESGLAVLLVVLGEVNPGALAILTAAALAHEATAHRDVALASGSARKVTAGERQTHNFLETLPFMLVGVLAARNWSRLRTTWPQPAVVMGAAAARYPIAGPVPAGGDRHPDRNRRHPLRRKAGPLPAPPRAPRQHGGSAGITRS